MSNKVADEQRYRSERNDGNQIIAFFIRNCTKPFRQTVRHSTLTAVRTGSIPVRAVGTNE